MSNTGIEVYNPKDVSTSVDSFSVGLKLYLSHLGLPTDSVLVSPSERSKVLSNIPSVADELTPAQRSRAMYMSKFVAACGAGLFDAALNFLWNETITNLRVKIAKFDLDYFYDSVVTDSKRRGMFKTEDDLSKMDDWELIKGCLVTGLVTEIGYKHLDYIRDMRNHASAAHPNQNQLSGLQVVSWLETCIREVLSKEPAGPVIEVKRLLHSIRNETFTTADVPHISRSLEALPSDLSQSLLRTIFGMMTDPRVPANTRNNILLIAKALWDTSSDDAKFDIGLKYATLSANGEVAKKTLAHQFMEAVQGLSYLPPESLALEIQMALQNLNTVHNAFNNFYNEPPHAQFLAKYVPASGTVPPSVELGYVKALLMCRMGNGYGVSSAALPTYDDLIERFSKRHTSLMLWLLAEDKEVASRLQFENCVLHMKTVLEKILSRTQDSFIQRAIQLILAKDKQNVAFLKSDQKYRDALADLFPKKK